jgi:sigma-B regulation protein RsbU (phosphoserine phosphatase)
MKILIAEDERISRRSLERQMEQWGHEVVAVEDGNQAWAAFQASEFDAVVTDWQMPGLGGDELVRRIRAATPDRFVYVIMITSRTDAEDAVAGLTAGADDFVRKPFDKAELRARLHAGERLVTLERTIRRQNRRMALDLEAGARYVRSMIPPPAPQGDPAIDWIYVPAADLAGDTLGFHWIDDNRCALYLLDVTGHGLDAALLSVTVLNVLRSMSLPATDFGRPSQVVATLNDKFPMEEHEDRCFTIWYGVYNRRTRELTWAGGGHPDALLLGPEGAADRRQRLSSTGPLMGMLADVEYAENSIEVPPGAHLFLVSDGAYEIDRPGQPQWTYDEMADFLAQHAMQQPLAALWRHVQEIGGQATLADDFTALQFRFI